MASIREYDADGKLVSGDPELDEFDEELLVALDTLSRHHGSAVVARAAEALRHAKPVREFEPGDLVVGDTDPNRGGQTNRRLLRDANGLGWIDQNDAYWSDTSVTNIRRVTVLDEDTVERLVRHLTAIPSRDLRDSIRIFVEGEAQR